MKNSLLKRISKAKTPRKAQAAVANYLDLPYSFTFIRDEDDGGFTVKVNELSGCISQGKTKDEALRRVRDAMYVWIESALQDGAQIPTPFEQGANFSGKVLVRMPKTLHRGLAERAEHEGVSLNQLAVAALAGSLGRSTA
jgi:antitoxin HicB